MESRRLCDRERTVARLPVLSASGEGRFVGLALHVYQKVDVTPGPWWGEGDEKFFVDGEKMPSWFGTGSEDYFGFSWGTPGYFSQAYHTQVLAPPGNLYAPGNRSHEPVPYFG